MEDPRPKNDLPEGPDARDILTKRDLARRWGFRSTRTIDRMIRSGRDSDAPRHFKIRSRVLFRLRDVEEFEKRKIIRQRPF